MVSDDGRLVLAIDTSLDDCSAAIAAGGGDRIVAARTERIGRGHAERLPGLIDGVLAEAGAGFRDIAMVAVTIGPGSFTGVRVGVSAARGYALALGIPSVGISSLHAMAEGVRTTHAVLAVHDAKRGEVYALLLGADGSILSPPRALAPESIGDMLAGIDGPIDLTGSAAEMILGTLPHHETMISSARSEIDIATVARLACGSVGVEAAKPLYLRSADAKPASRPFSLFAQKA
ncbi:tRNA (adenosine(37)-N6)-threonylcarbamoyltransferase complex dimerization subunit type 1 TsaB [Fulvimarina endophytica]|uniref:tRNA (Adenosine(37)-N6)-threonylcarbamoyltransferase complex dimerization subunit type 1 TsaB n=1 Tax=Fulvimarina endophytica TaxID=2293836 RepID=A0A371X138_9HYPH|nr:tRNA (adenosine(37)-N6)-threonylcarbamoyltransferase complex dimerization subunit type 1 TsaB [Fulvimarina endophytica]RFC62933.1 tRNA (adenosine(37)-N6)-threonylcarbamoyltransferase complex dimerization subunit type 1 TsaB [Fulvimarina endophytica]